MQNLNELLSSLPEYAKDTKINLQSVLNKENNVLDSKQVSLIALSCAYKIGNQDIVQVLENEFANDLSNEEIRAAKIAASIMSMNTIYYRFVHLVDGGDEYLKIPAGLRMQGIANHGIDKVSFEAMSLSIAALEGCGMCLTAHEKQLAKAGLTKSQIQMAIKIAAVINATNQSLKIK